MDQNLARGTHLPMRNGTSPILSELMSSSIKSKGMSIGWEYSRFVDPKNWKPEKTENKKETH